MKNEITPCWILASARTGSSYLSQLLNSTKLFGKYRFSEHYNFKKKIAKNVFPFVKIHYKQYKERFGNIDINTILPNVKYILIKRKNHYETAVSRYFALKSKYKKWNVSNKKQLKKKQNEIFTFEEKSLLCSYEIAKAQYSSWDNYLENKKFIKFEYEYLCENPEKVTKTILEYLQLEGSPDFNYKKITMKLNHPQKSEFVERLQELVESNYNKGMCVYPSSNLLIKYL